MKCELLNKAPVLIFHTIHKSTGTLAVAHVNVTDHLLLLRIRGHCFSSCSVTVVKTSKRFYDIFGVTNFKQQHQHTSISTAKAFSWNGFGHQIPFELMFTGNNDYEGERKPIVLFL